MTELVNYSFVRANANPLPDPPWKVGSHAPGAQVLSNQCRNADTSYYALALSYYDGGVTWPADQWAQIVMSAADGGGDHYIGPVVHYNDTNNSFYAANATAGELQLQRVSGGAFTVVANPAGNFVVSDVIRLESQTVGGSKFLKLFINDVQVLSYEDTSPLADGVAGIWFYSPSAAASSFQAGDFGGGADVTLALTGQAAASAAGTLGPATLKALSGQVATSARGTPAPARDKVLSGHAMTGSRGTLAVTRTKALTGHALTSARGTLTPGRALALTGLSITTAQGAVSTDGDVILALTGLLVTSAQGVLANAATKALTGQSATSARGTLGVTRSSAITGHGAALTSGTVTPVLSLSLSGLASTLGQGEVTPATGLVVQLTGQAAAMSIGTLAVSAAAGLTGVLGTWSLGAVSVDGAVITPQPGRTVTVRARDRTVRVRSRS